MKTLWAITTAVVLWLTGVATAAAGVGEPDVRFAANGRLNVSATGVYAARVLQTPDGRFVVVGMPITGNVVDHGRLVVARYLANGRPDPTFGSGGRVTVPLPVTQEPLINAAALQEDGKILIAGAGGVGSDLWVRYVARFDASGNPDTDFGIGGVVNGGFAGNGFDGWGPGYSQLLALPNGDVLAVIDDPDARFVDRYSSTGTLISHLALDRPTIGIATQGSGAAIILSRSASGSVLRRVNRSGFDDQFGDGGSTQVTNVSADALAVDAATSRIAVCGDGIGRWTAGGRLDGTFGTSGSGTLKFDGVALPQANRCDAVAYQSDGRLLAVASDVHGTAAVSHRTVVVRVDALGAVDGGVGSGQGVAELRGMQAPTVYWQAQSLQIAATGETLLTWNRSGLSGDRGVIVESIDLAQALGRGAVGLSQPDLRINERGGSVELKIVRSGMPVGEASVRYEIAHGTTTAADVVVADGTLRWADGDGVTRSIVVTLFDDAQLEGEETFQVRLFDAAGVDVPAQSPPVTIIDDDALRALRFADDKITWTTGPAIPVSDWPQWKLHLDDALPVPVTAYYYLTNGIDSCCFAGVQWAVGETGLRKIAPFPGEALGSEYWVVIVDDGWGDAGPTASVKVVVDPTPDGSGGSGGGSSGGNGGSGGGGALDGPASALWLGAALLLAARRGRPRA